MTHARQVNHGAGADKFFVLFTYVSATTVMLCGAYLLAAAGDDFVRFFALSVFFLLGPLGIIVFATFALPVVFAVWNAAWPSVLGLAIVVPLSAVTALLNVLIVFGWIAHLHSSVRSTDQRVGDTVLGRVASAALFVASGFVFIALCVVTGYLALSSGQSTAHPDGASFLGPFLFAVWFLGLIVAVAGLAVWIVSEVRARRSLLWAVVDVLVQIALVAAVCFGSGPIARLG